MCSDELLAAFNHFVRSRFQWELRSTSYTPFQTELKIIEAISLDHNKTGMRGALYNFGDARIWESLTEIDIQELCVITHRSRVTPFQSCHAVWQEIANANKETQVSKEIAIAQFTNFVSAMVAQYGDSVLTDPACATMADVIRAVSMDYNKNGMRGRLQVHYANKDWTMPTDQEIEALCVSCSGSKLRVQRTFADMLEVLTQHAQGLVSDGEAILALQCTPHQLDAVIAYNALPVAVHNNVKLAAWDEHVAMKTERGDFPTTFR